LAPQSEAKGPDEALKRGVVLSAGRGRRGHRRGDRRSTADRLRGMAGGRTEPVPARDRLPWVGRRGPAAQPRLPPPSRDL